MPGGTHVRHGLALPPAEGHARVKDDARRHDLRPEEARPQDRGGPAGPLSQGALHRDGRPHGGAVGPAGPASRSGRRPHPAVRLRGRPQRAGVPRLGRGRRRRRRPLPAHLRLDPGAGHPGARLRRLGEAGPALSSPQGRGRSRRPGVRPRRACAPGRRARAADRPAAGDPPARGGDRTARPDRPASRGAPLPPRVPRHGRSCAVPAPAPRGVPVARGPPGGACGCRDAGSARSVSSAACR